MLTALTGSPALPGNRYLEALPRQMNLKNTRIFNLIVPAIASVLLLISWNLFQSVSSTKTPQREYLTISAAISLSPALAEIKTIVESGNVDAGIVYTTDAKVSSKVAVQATAAENSHSPIVYPVAIMKSSRNPGAAKMFVKFLAGDRAKIVFQKYGFGIVRH